MSRDPLRVSESISWDTDAYVDLPAIVAGALISAAIAFLLTTFGSAIGLTMLSPWRGEGVSGTVFVLAIGLWTIWVVVSSMMTGGYVAGRLRRRIADISDHEVEVRDGLNGLVVWALATLFVAWMTANATAGAAKAGGAALQAGAAATAEAASTAASEIADSDAANEALGSVADNLRSVTDRLLRSSQPASDETITRMLADATGADPDATDREFLVQAIANRTGLSTDEAAARVDEAYAEARRLADEARAVADKARKVGVLVAFVSAASLLAGAVGAWWAATRGGRHRDQRTDFSRYIRFSD